MNEKSKELFQLAQHYKQQLSQHPILSRYWDSLSLVVKGSISRGNCDQYSDIDFVFFCSDDDLASINRDYLQAGLTDRTDGVFIPLEDWVGHYHFESYSRLQSYFDDYHFPHVWEFQQAIPIHDPKNAFQKLMEQASREFLKEPVPFIKQKYLDLLLTLDWLRHPLKRGDQIAAHLHCAKIVADLCKIAYLLDGQSYPHDKWIAAYLSDTRFGRLYESDIHAYLTTFPTGRPLTPHMELEAYPCYSEGLALINQVGSFVREHYEDYPWIDRWYEYV